MKLTKEQLQQIENYIAACGIKWYDVRMELVDHFASSLESKLKENSALDFKQTIVNEHKSFSDQGFKKLLNTKTKAVEKQFYKQVFKQMQSFFKIPKIIISAGLFYGLVLLMNLFSNKEYFFMGLTFVLFTILIILVVRMLKEKKKKKTRFLILNKNNNFFNSFNLLVILFSNSISLRTEESFNNVTNNYIHIGVFVLILLFYWCAEYVFSKNKKYVTTNYPEIAI